MKIIKEQIEMDRRDKFNDLISAKNEDLKNDLKKLVSYPLLLRYFRAHIKSLTGIQYVDDRKVIVTSSSDFNVRLYTLTGRYIGFFGQDYPWNQQIPTNSNLTLIKPSMPRDLRRIASANTIQVVYGVTGSKWKLLQKTVLGIFSKSKYYRFLDYRFFGFFFYKNG
jgi:hypothetical protein